MILRWLLRTALCCAIGWCAETTAGLRHDPLHTWYTVRTPHFVIHFHHGLGAISQDVGRIAEQTYDRLTALFGWEPVDPTEIVLSDEVEVANGFSQPLPRNWLTLWITDPDEIESDVGVWLESLIVHEFTHTLHLDMASGAPLNLRSLFGRHPLLFPDQFQPAWLIEGIATFMETDSGRGIGRGQSSYFDMLMRSEVLQGVKPLQQVNQTLRTWPAGKAHYLYGVYFYKFLAERYGEPRLWNWLKRYRSHLIPFKINTNSKQAFGKDLLTLWDEFSLWLNARYQSQVVAVEAQGLQDGEIVSQHGYDTHSSIALADGTIYYVRNDGRTHSAVMRLRPGETKPVHLCDVSKDARIDAHPQAGVLIAQPENIRNAGLVYDLFRCDEESGRAQRITRGQHFRNVAWAPDGHRIAALKSSRGKQSVVILDSSGRLVDVIRTVTGDERIGQFAWFPDGSSLVMSIRSQRGSWDLHNINLIGKVMEQLTFDDSIELHPRVSLDGLAVLYAADYDGIYNIARLVLGNERPQLLTNVIGGAFYPSMSGDGTLVFTRNTPSGFDVAKIEAVESLRTVNTPRGTENANPESTEVSVPMPNFPSAGYTPQPWLIPSWWSPLVAWDKNWRTLGLETSSSDALERHQYALSLSYDQNYKVLMGGVDYVYDRYFPVMGLQANRDFSLYRINDTVAFVRGNDYINVGVTMPFLFQRERWASFVGVGGNREFDQYVAPGIYRAPDLRDYLVGFAFTYDSTRVYPLSISRSEGRQVLATMESSDFAKSNYSGKVVTLDWREFVALGGEQVAAFRFFQGHGENETRRFQLGGSDPATTAFVADRVGTASPLNRRNLSLRGYPEGITSLRGIDAQLVSAEWRFPLARVERGMMAPPVGLDQTMATLFVDTGGVAHLGLSPEEWLTGVGAELHADTRFFYSVPVRVRVGVARGIDRRGETQLYINLGGSF